MATAEVTHQFTNDTNADATQVNTNFDDLVDFINDEVVHRDGTNLATALTSQLGGEWSTYTPTWGVAAGTFTLGNGTSAGRYKKVGRHTTFVAWLICGSTTSMSGGSSDYLVTTAPTTSANITVAVPLHFNVSQSSTATATTLDDSSAAWLVAGTNTVRTSRVTFFGASVSGASGHTLVISGTYESAT